MPVTISQVEDRPILHFHVTDPIHDAVTELEAAYDQAAELLTTFEGPYVRIFNAADADINFAQMVLGMGAASRGKPGSASDPRALKTLYVGPDLALVADSLSQEQYGRLSALWFVTLEAALRHARHLVSEGQRV